MSSSVTLDSRLAQIAADLEREAAASADRTAQVVATRARATVPVRTGRTQASIRVMGRATAGRGAYRRNVRVKFPGRFLEYGTQHMAPRPFMVPAAKAAEARFDAEMRRLAALISR